MVVEVVGEAAVVACELKIPVVFKNHFDWFPRPWRTEAPSYWRMMAYGHDIQYTNFIDSKVVLGDIENSEWASRWR